MLHRLGLDVGTNSLGWSLISLDNTSAPQTIIDAGARIFDDGRVKKSLASLKADRRVARQARRRRDRFLQRQKSLRRALIKWGLFPLDKEAQKQLETLDPYDIHARAIDEMCDPYHIGRAFWHINQRRGFKSNRKTADNEAGVVKKSIAIVTKDMKDAKIPTVGVYLAQRRAQMESV